MGNLKNAYALIIGVGSDLPKTVSDANAIYNLLASADFGGYDRDKITLLYEETATRDGILKAFDDLIEKTDEESSVLLFYSGHGGTYTTNDLLELGGKPTVSAEENKDFFYLVPSNFDPKDFNNTWVKAEELRDKIRALESKRLIFFLDCCHAAGMTQAMTFTSDFTPQQEMTNADGLAQNIDDGSGMSIVSSCREDQKSWILDGDFNSLFTRCLLEVMRGEHKKHLEEPFIRISEVIQYIFRMVPERKPIQRPYANIQIYDDFIVSKVPAERVIELGIEESPSGESQEKGAPQELVTVYRETEGANSVLLFVHGFTGEAADSFGKLPELLMEDPKMNGWDLFPLGFSGAVKPHMGKDVWASVDDIEKIADYLKTAISFKFGHYKRIAIIGYSLGGLAVQRTLVQLSPKHRSRISHLLLMGTPNNGLVSEKKDKESMDKIADLKSDASFIQDLRKDWDTTFNNQYPFDLKTVAATDDEFIPVASSLNTFPEEYRAMVAGSHFTMVKPETKDNDCYELLVSTLCGDSFLNVHTDSAAINLALGDYEAVVTEMLPKANDLDKKGVAKLIFAMEALGRGEEALKVLQAHPSTENNSDLQGIIGGRYKRAYLSQHKLADGEAAFARYSKGLEMSRESGNQKQIFYHAINLAFLSLVLHEEEGKMLAFAKEAKEAAEPTIDNLWKLATMGEAHIYLGKWEEAKEYYARAAVMADIREKISIHTNAYLAYSTLMETENPEDDFIKFLKANFLS